MGGLGETRGWLAVGFGSLLVVICFVKDIMLFSICRFLLRVMVMSRMFCIV